MKRFALLSAFGVMLCGGQSFSELVAASEAPVWISYTVPIVPGQRQMCNWNEQRKLMLEGARELTVLFRVEHKVVQKLRVATDECEIDAGGIPLKRIQMTPAESIALLSSYMSNETALHAISLHRDPAAVQALVKAARTDVTPRVRGKALFWLASSAQRTIAQEEIQRAIDQDPETEVKKSAVFALSRLPADEGLPKLMELARTGRHPEVRKQAMFWIGQSKDPRAIDFFEAVLTKR